jgi:hypothetical protein
VQRRNQRIVSGVALHCQAQVLLAGTDLVAALAHHQPIVLEQTIAQLSSRHSVRQFHEEEVCFGGIDLQTGVYMNERLSTVTRLKRLSSLDQERLINWGYAVCDAATRKHVDPTLPTPVGFPYQAAGVGN